jgi:hypothetical protein
MGADRTVSYRPDGTWENKRNELDKATSVHKTQTAAVDEARRLIAKQGGGELIVKAKDGRVWKREKIKAKDPKLP